MIEIPKTLAIWSEKVQFHAGFREQDSFYHSSQHFEVKSILILLTFTIMGLKEKKWIYFNPQDLKFTYQRVDIEIR